MKTITAIVSAAVLAAVAGHAAAQSDEPRTVTISYADLDLSKDAGRAALERRIDLAVSRVCPARPLPMELDMQKAYQDCHKAAWAGARQRLAAIYSGRQLAEASVRVGGPAN